MSDPNSTHPDRRTFLQIAGALVGVSVTAASADGSARRGPDRGDTLGRLCCTADSRGPHRICRGRGPGGSHVRNMLGVPGVRITAVCDIAEDRVKLVQKLVVAAGQKEPTGYTRGPRDFERLCETEDLDLVFTATPWEWHVPVWSPPDEWQARGNRSAGGQDGRRLLAARRGTRRNIRSTA